MQYTELEEEEHRHKYGNQHRQDGLHGQVAFGPLARFHILFTFELFNGKPQRLTDDFRGFDDADDTGHGDTADTERTAVVEEELLGRHVPHRLQNTLAYGQRHAGCEVADERDEYEPDGERTGADERGIFQPHYIPEAEHRRARIHLEHHLELIGYHFAPGEYPRRDGLRPEPYAARDEVIQTAHEPADSQHLGLIALLLARHKHLGSRGGFRERQLSVHVLDEIFPERYNEQDTEQAAEKRRKENLIELRLQPQNIECRKRKNSSGDDNPGACADGLDNGVLSERVLLSEDGAHADGDNRYRYGRLEHLPHFQTEISRSRREEDGHDEPHRNRIGGNLLRLRAGGQDGFVRFARLQLGVGIVGQRVVLLIFLHMI